MILRIFANANEINIHVIPYPIFKLKDKICLKFSPECFHKAYLVSCNPLLRDSGVFWMWPNYIKFIGPITLNLDEPIKQIKLSP